MVKKGGDQLVLLQWAREVDRVREEFAAGLISRTEACNRLTVQDGKRFTVRDAWEAYYPTIENRGTARAYHAAWDQRLREPFGDMAMEELTDDVLVAWRNEQAKSVTQKGTAPSDKTVQNAWECLKAAIKYQLGKRLDRVPWHRFKVKVRKHRDLPTEREALRTFEEMQRLIRGAAEEDAKLLGTVPGKKYADLAPRVAILLLTGIRSGEGCALGFDDFVERTGVPYLDIRHQVTPNWRTENPDWERPKAPPKNGRALIPVHNDVVKLIEYQKAQLMALGWYRPDGPIFPGRSGQWRNKPELIDPNRMRDLVKKYIPEADWKRFVTHSTRHSFATVLSVAMQGNEKAAMALTRHADERVFSMYRHLAGRGLIENPLPATDVAMPERPKQLPPHDPNKYPHPDEWAPENGDVVEGILEAGLASLVAVTPERAREFEAQRLANRREEQNKIKSRYKASNATDFETAWRRWTEAGRPGERPYEVTAAMTLAYDRVRKDVRRRGLTGTRRVQKNERTWEACIRHQLEIPVEKAVPCAIVEEVRALNQNRDKPPLPGNEYKVPAEWEARKRARASRRAVLMAWEAFRKKRDAIALRRGECTDEPDGKVRFVESSVVQAQVGQIPWQEEEADNDGQKTTTDDK